MLMDTLERRAVPGRLVLIAIALAQLWGCANPDAAWQAAEREDTVNAYLEFLARYPDGELADQARARIRQVKEDSDWEHVQFRDSLEDYAAFLKEYPDTERRGAIEARIAELERAAAWKVAQDNDTVPAYELFLAGYGDFSEADIARARIAELQAAEKKVEEAVTERPGNFRVQLGTFRTVVAAETELRRLMALFPETLMGPVWIETPEHRGGGRNFRLKTVPMTGEEARATCAALKRARQTCIVVNR